MEVSMKFFLFVLASLSLAATLFSQTIFPPESWIIIPGVKAGPITAKTTKEELAFAYGSRDVRIEALAVDTNIKQDAIVIYGSTPIRRLEIFEDPLDSRSKLLRLLGNRSFWKLSNGIGLGTTLKELEKLNGRAFKLAGWGHEYGGNVYGWEGGDLKNIAPFVTMSLEASADRVKLLSDEERSSVGDAVLHSSSEAVIQKLNPKVTYLVVGLQR
jgi:hypothetical protein